MSRPWMPLYPADFLADTEHLTAAESGAYLLLLMHYWQRGQLPDDDARLTRIARMTEAEWRTARPVIAAFFEHPGWKHGRVEDELAKAASISTKRRAAAEQRYGKEDETSSNANAGANEDANEDTNGVHLHTPSPSPSQLQSESQDQDALARARDDDFEKFWEVYPQRGGSNPKQPAFKRFQMAVKSGVPPDRIIDAARRYADEIRQKGDGGSKFVAQSVRWLSEQRWVDYPAPTAPTKLQVFVSEGTEQWQAWQAFLKTTTGKGSPIQNFGWYFPTEWPPDHQQKVAA